MYFLCNFQNTKNKTAVKLTAVSCAPVVEVKIKRPDTKYQLGFSVQNGVVSTQKLFSQSFFFFLTFLKKNLQVLQASVLVKREGSFVKTKLN